MFLFNLMESHVYEYAQQEPFFYTASFKLLSMQGLAVWRLCWDIAFPYKVVPRVKISP